MCVAWQVVKCDRVHVTETGGPVSSGPQWSLFGRRRARCSHVSSYVSNGEELVWSVYSGRRHDAAALSRVPTAHRSAPPSASSSHPCPTAPAPPAHPAPPHTACRTPAARARSPVSHVLSRKAAASRATRFALRALL